MCDIIASDESRKGHLRKKESGDVGCVYIMTVKSVHTRL